MTSSMHTDSDFESRFPSLSLKCLTLASHNSMNQSMKEFVIANKNVLKKFRLTGTNSSMAIFNEVYGDDPTVSYGSAYKSYGDDVRGSDVFQDDSTPLQTMIVSGQIGGCILFIDPMHDVNPENTDKSCSHPHDSYIQCFMRHSMIHNIMLVTNPMSAQSMMNSIRIGMMMGIPELLPSFFYDAEVPIAHTRMERKKRLLDRSTNSSSVSALSVVDDIAPKRGDATTIFACTSNAKSFPSSVPSISDPPSIISDPETSVNSIDDAKTNLRRKEEQLRLQIEQMTIIPAQNDTSVPKYQRKLRFNGHHLELRTKKSRKKNLPTTDDSSKSRSRSRRRITWRNWER